MRLRIVRPCPHRFLVASMEAGRSALRALSRPSRDFTPQQESMSGAGRRPPFKRFLLAFAAAGLLPPQAERVGQCSIDTDLAVT